MFNKKNPMRYFSGSTFARLPLYKLAAGGTALWKTGLWARLLERLS